MLELDNEKTRAVLLHRCRLSIVLIIAMAATGYVAASGLAGSPATTAKAPPLAASLEDGAPVCTEYSLGRLTAASRLADPNRKLLIAAQSALAPGFKSGKATDGLRLLADYQAEMEAVKPNQLAAAAYLAMASTIPLNLKVVERVNSLLCVTASPVVAKSVAANAAAQWQQMHGGK